MIQFDLPADVDKKVRRFMVDHDIVDKRTACVEMLRRAEVEKKRENGA